MVGYSNRCNEGNASAFLIYVGVDTGSAALAKRGQ